MICPNDIALLQAFKTYKSNGRPVNRHREPLDVDQSDQREKESQRSQ